MTSAPPEPKFKVGDIVIRSNKPHDPGRVLGLGWAEDAGLWHYRVAFSHDGNRGLYEGHLILAVFQDDMWKRLKAGQVSGVDYFIDLMTFHRLRRPPSIIATSYGTSKTAFYAYQFKPLLMK